MRAIDADRVRFVHDQSRAIRQAERGVLSQGRHIAVHAKERFGDHEFLAGRGVLPQQARQGARVAVRKDNAARRRKAHAIDETGVVTLVGVDHVTFFGHGGQHREIGEVAA